MIAWGATDKGLVRHHNEDSYKIIELAGAEQVVCVVCDGMGGACAGDVASDLAVRAFSEEIDRTGVAGIEKAVYAANRAVYQRTLQNPELDGMGTTLVAVAVSGSEAVVANVGDSRAYILNKTGINRITTDHSVVENLILTGEITEDEAKTYPGKHLITRALGTEAEVEIDIYRVEVHSGDYILLCSDGLTNMLEAGEIQKAALFDGEEADSCVRLIDMANLRGGKDNITAVLVKI